MPRSPGGSISLCRAQVESLYESAGISCAEVGTWKGVEAGSCLDAACTPTGEDTLSDGDTNYVSGCVADAPADPPATTFGFLSDERYCPVNDVREHADSNKDVAAVAAALKEPARQRGTVLVHASCLSNTSLRTVGRPLCQSLVTWLIWSEQSRGRHLRPPSWGAKTSRYGWCSIGLGTVCVSSRVRQSTAMLNSEDPNMDFLQILATLRVVRCVSSLSRVSRSLGGVSSSPLHSPCGTPL